MTSRSRDPFKAAEAVFSKKAPAVETPKAAAAVPGAREQVTLRIDRDVLDHFQADGPGWQDRINAALRTLIDRG